MKFDDFYVSINDWGKYQKLKYLIICLSYMLPSMMVYVYSFTAAIPEFRCQNPQLKEIDEYNQFFNDLYRNEYLPRQIDCDQLKKRIHFKECQRCFIRISSSLMTINQTDERINSSLQLQSCQTFVYDRRFYLKTLTEEVIDFHSIKEKMKYVQ